MNELIAGVFSAPLASLLVIAGILFLLIAVIGNISGKIEPGARGRLAAGVFGILFLSIGLAMHFLNSPDDRLSGGTGEGPGDVVEAPEKAVGEKGISSGPEIEQDNGKAPSNGTAPDIEPNDDVTNARVVAVGKRLRGSLATKQDRDFYKFDAPSRKTRVIVRKPSLPGVNATVEIYDLSEKKIASDTGIGDEPASLVFESEAGASYYAVVKPFGYQDRGDYELVIRAE